MFGSTLLEQGVFPCSDTFATRKEAVTELGLTNTYLQQAEATNIPNTDTMQLSAGTPKSSNNVSGDINEAPAQAVCPG